MTNGTRADPAYDAAFFGHVNATARSAAAVIVPLLRELLAPRSVLDVGCGQGAWLAAWRDAGVADLAGVDGDYVDRRALLIPAAAFRAHDLVRPLALGRRFDLVQCLEVAEHLPAAAAPVLLDGLARHADRVLFSAAPPGQGGHDHVNERSYEYWRAEFALRGFVAFDCVRPRVRADRRVAPWYRYNPLLYVQAAAVAALPPLLRASELQEGVAVPDLAPLAYRVRRQLVRRLPVAAMTAIARLRERLRRAGVPGPGG